jgi:pimeloyl-ACP methyl ester carboxylesterase
MPMRAQLSLSRLPVCLLVLLLPCGNAAARELGQLSFEPCTLAPKALPVTVDAQCTTLAVPENPAEPQGRQIELALAWIPARAEAEADPVFMLAGGPGQSARDSYPMIAHAFREIGRSRHVLLLDQRGTGGSNPLVCRDADGTPSIMDDLLDASPEAVGQFAERCRDQLAGDADLRFYTTTDAVADLDRVRAAIGADTVNLIGISYGTRVAQQYARRHPDRVRSLVLDGVAPNGQVLGSEHARNLEDALALQFAACGADSRCAERLGNPRERLTRLAAELKANPRPVRFRDATSGEPREEILRFEHLAGVVRMYSYAPSMAAMLPLILAETDQGHDEALMAQAHMLFGQVGESINHGMQLSVLCAEDAPLLRENPDDAGTVIGVEFVQFIRAQCAVWPIGERPADFFEPLQSDLPTLLLSGELDPVTPPRYGDEVLAGLSNARHLILPGQGHNVLPVGCTPRLVARFVEKLDPQALEADCLDTLPRLTPFAGFYGWEP